jgi:hypothetical protein
MGRQRRRPVFGYVAVIEYRRRGLRRVQLFQGGARSPEEFAQWHTLKGDDIFAREIGTMFPCKSLGGYGDKEGWPATYQKLEDRHGLARTREEWERAQVFEIDNPAGSPWPGWERLSIDPLAPFGPDDWVVSVGPGANPKRRKYRLGKVERLKRSFEIEDVTTGKRLKLGGLRPPYHGVVIGRARSADALKRTAKPKAKKPARVETNGARSKPASSGGLLTLPARGREGANAVERPDE